jgi:hypothetical protein
MNPQTRTMKCTFASLFSVVESRHCDYKMFSSYLLSDGDDDDLSPDWNLRKCSASTLDKLSGRHKNDMLRVLLPLLKVTDSLLG